MHINKNSNYVNFNNFYELLSEDSIVYVYSKTETEAFEQLEEIFSLCNKYNLYPKDVFIDIDENNNIDCKKNLKAILKDKENIDLIVIKPTCISNYCVDHWEVERNLNESNIGVYDIKEDDFVYERKPLLFWLSKGVR